MVRGGQVLVDGTAVGDEAEAQLEVAGQAAVGGQGQDQQGGEEEEAYHQQGHTAPVLQEVRAVQRGTVGAHLGEGRERRKGQAGMGLHTNTHTHTHDSLTVE